MPDAERSASRGRAVFQSTGRGGIGNIRQPSSSRDARPESGPDDFSVTRGRELISNPNQVFSTGRGGAGNLRSPSRDVHTASTLDGVEEDVIRGYRMSQEDAPVSSGRGGLGNINRSRSRDPASNLVVHSSGRGGLGNTNRSRSRDPVSNPIVHSTGRGGAGNIVAGEGSFVESISEDDLKKHHATHEGYHSTGRGGNANITSATEPAIEHHVHIKGGFQSTGRGGVGNIVEETTD